MTKSILILLLCLSLASCAKSPTSRLVGTLPPIEEYSEPQIFGMEVISTSVSKFYVSDNMTEIEFSRLVEYFMAALTIPTKDLWVNLKLGERHRITPFRLGITELGKIMLEQDYLLKTAVATTLHPDTFTGNRYWSELDIIGGGNKVNFVLRTCIIPDEVEILDGDISMLIKKATLDVEREEEYANFAGFEEIIDDTIMTEVKRYVSSDINFAPIRQAFRAVICAIWFKNKFLNSEYRSYINQDKTSGIEIEPIKEKIWDEYALMRKNKNWCKRSIYSNYYGKTRTRKRQYGGVAFQTVSERITVKESTHEFVGKSFEVEFIPLTDEVAYEIDDFEIGTLGGISLDARIAVREGTIKASEDDKKRWRLLKGLDYSIIRR